MLYPMYADMKGNVFNVYFCILMLYTQQEAETIVDLLKEFPTAKAWVCFSCQVRHLFPLNFFIFFIRVCHNFLLV